MTEFKAGDRVRITAGERTGKTGVVESEARSFSGGYLIRVGDTDFDILYWDYELEPENKAPKTPREVWDEAPEGQAFYTEWGDEDAPVVWVKMTKDTKPEDVTNAHVHTLWFSDLARLVPITIHWDQA